MSTKVHTEQQSSNMNKYMLGFIISILLTTISFAAVMFEWINEWSVSSKVLFLFGLAFIQMFAQIIYFFHLNEGPDAKWNMCAMCISIICVFIIIVGSWATMQHLNYNMMGGSGRVIRDTTIRYPYDHAEEVLQERIGDEDILKKRQ